MDALKAQLDRLQQQLAGLSVSQKMLAGSLAAIMVITLLWWSRYAAQAEMEPVFPQAFKQSEVGPITARLRELGIRYTIAADGRILVPAEQRETAFAELTYAQVLPADTSSAYSEALAKLSPFDSPTKTDRMLADAHGTLLARVIQRFPGVYTATVVMNSTRERRVGAQALLPTATVSIETREGSKADKPKLAQAAAHAVAGAQSGLEKSRISVLIDGRVFPVHDDADGLGAGGSVEFFEHKLRVEQAYRQKIQDALHYIPHAIVSVTVDVQNTTKQTESQTVDPDKTVHKPIVEEVTSKETSSSHPTGAGEPGIVPNSGLSTGPTATPGAEATRTETQEQQSTKYQLETSKTHETTRTPAGKDTVQAASVAIPRSYLVAWYQRQQRAAAAAAAGSAAGGAPTLAAAAMAEPDDAALAAIEERVKADVRQLVRSNTNLPPDAIVVTTYYDTSMDAMFAAGVGGGAAGGGGGAGEPTAASIVGTAVGTYAKEIGIGALALVSLLMVATMVRRGGAAPAVAVAGPADPRQPPPFLQANEEIAGEAGDGDPMLDGMELDEDAVRTEQMLNQVQTMVKENPDAAAALVKRWLNRS